MRPVREFYQIFRVAVLLLGATNVSGGKATAGPYASVAKGFTRQRSSKKIHVAWSGSSRADARFPLLHLNLCLNCPNPVVEGSIDAGLDDVLDSPRAYYFTQGHGIVFVASRAYKVALISDDHTLPGESLPGLAPYHGLRDFRVEGDVAYAVPNKCQSDILNVKEIIGRIVLVDRGEVSIIEKVLKTQTAGAKGVIVVDNGSCGQEFEYCGVQDGGFSREDGTHAWTGVKIPVVLVSEAEGQRLKGAMRLRTVVFERLGEQLVEQKQDE